MRTYPPLMAVLFLLAACQPVAPPAEVLRSVRVQTVQLGQVSAVHEYAGEIRGRTESRLGFRVGGKLVQRFVNVGDRIKSGQLLAKIDSRDLSLSLDAARAAVQTAKVQYDLALAELKRYQSLRDQGFISGAELDRRESVVRSASAQLEQAKAQANAQENQVSYSMLHADEPGVVVAVEAEPGAVMAAGAPVIRVALDGPRDVVFAVPEDRVDALRQSSQRGSAFAVRLWGEGDRTFPVTIREVAASADAATRTFTVKADVGSAKVKLGQTATVFETRQVETTDTPADVARLPLSSVFEFGGRSNVWLLTDEMTVKRQPVTVIGADGNAALIGSGLKSGQTVVTAGVHVLTDGQKVRRYVEPKRPGGTTGQKGGLTPTAASVPATR